MRKQAVRTPKIKVYVLPNSDGTHQELVAASSQAGACELMGVSLYSFVTYGGHRTDDPSLALVAMSKPLTVFKRKIPSVLPRDAVNPWTEVRRG